MRYIYDKTKRILSILLAIMVIMSAFSSAFVVVVNADPDDPHSGPTVSIESVNMVLEYGADKVGDQYIWTPKNIDSGHDFVYRIDYVFSGTGELAPGEIKLKIPKSILHDRNGNSADVYELSVPHIDEAEETTDYAYYEDGDYLYIVNCIELTAAQDGYFELSYSTSETTYEYKDNDPNFCDIPECTVTISREGESDVTETRSAPKVGINTAAEISSTSKSYNYRRATSWNSSWGEKPADADDYYYLCWTIYTTFSDCTQPFDFKLTDILSETEKDGETVSEIVGYKMSGASGFSDTNTVYDQRPNRILYSDNSSLLYRYDYVLTRHKKSAFPVDTDFSIENKIVATVTPRDLVDPETEEEAVESFINVPAKYKAPIGSYWSEKYGSGRLNYSLDDLRDGVIHYTDTNLYYNVYLYSQAYLWTLEDGASVTDVDKFGKKKVKFEITDDKFTFNGNDRQLTKDDYEIRSVSFDYTFYDAGFNEDELEFYSKSPTYADDETFEIDAKFGDSDEFVRIGRYNLKTGQSEIENAYRDKVRSIASNRIVFEDDALCTGYRITTENVHYYSRINAYPYCRLKGSPYIIEKMGNLNKVYLTNTATTKLFSGETEMFSRTSSANDVIVGVLRQSYINKYCTSSTNNKVKKYISNNWTVNMYESIELEDGISRVEQENGRFYDLLPMGCEVSEATVRVVNQNGQLPVSDYTVSFIQNYNETDRTMMVVDVNESGTEYTLYYTTTYSWDSFIDYGMVLDNSVAYETGNANIASGYPDNGGNIPDKELMKELDPDTNDKKFIYANRKKVISNILITATTGITKKVVAKGVDPAYSLETTLGSNAPYTYKLRLATNASSRARNIFLYDSLENFKINGNESDWRGTLLKVDVSQPKSMGIKPVVYYSPIADLDLAAANHRNYCLSIDTVNGKNRVSFSQYDSGGNKVWYTKAEMDEFGGISAAKAICIDLSKDTNGNYYTLEFNKALAVVVNMQSPPTDTTGSDDPRALNNVYGFNTVVGDFGSEDNNYIYHNYTKVHYRIMGDVGIYKADSTDLSKPLKDICFVLEGKSDYGTNVYSLLPTDINGKILFRNIEKGTYKLYETEGSIDYQMIKDNMTVVIDGDGIASIDGASSVTNTSPEPEEGKFTNGYYTIPNKPRVHTDIEINKRNLAKKKQGVEGVKFRLSGMSSYGNNIILYGVSDETGKVVIYNVEPGTYTLVETETVDGMILNETDYSVTVDNSGEFTIENALQDKDGSYVIYNEPYHSFTLQKNDFISAEPLSGAKFRLTGVSSSGKNVDITKTSGSNGRLTFDGLESGTYTLVETDPPEGYFKDEEKHIVSITKEDVVTITGLEKNDAGNFVVENKKDGTVTIVKKWEDDKDNSERPTPVVHLSVPRKVPSATFLGRQTIVNDNNNFT